LRKKKKKVGQNSRKAAPPMNAGWDRQKCSPNPEGFTKKKLKWLHRLGMIVILARYSTAPVEKRNSSDFRFFFFIISLFCFFLKKEGSIQQAFQAQGIN